MMPTVTKVPKEGYFRPQERRNSRGDERRRKIKIQVAAQTQKKARS
jgi:hypothetical protein